MKFFHFLNCAALAYVPYFILYKYSGISEYCSFWRCLKAIGCYGVTQFIKMLILATCFPDLESDDYSTWMDFLKTIADGIDACGLYFTISYFLTGRGEYRAFAAGFGFAVAHAVAIYGVSFLNVARATAFHSHYLQLALEANLDLFFYLAFAVIIWLHSRNDFAPQYRLFFLSLTVMGVVKNFVFNTFYHLFMIQSWLFFVLKFGFVSIYCLMAIGAYSLFRSHLAMGHVKQS